MRAALVVLLSLGWIGGTALAQVDAPVLSAHAPSSRAPEPAPAKAKKEKRRGRRGDVARQPEAPSSADDTLQTCLAMWEPATHMSRREWGRACRRVADRLRNTAVR